MREERIQLVMLQPWMKGLNDPHNTGFFPASAVSGGSHPAGVSHTQGFRELGGLFPKDPKFSFIPRSPFKFL